MLNPLLDDIRDDETRFLIENGNLFPQKKLIPRWTPTGYVAHLQACYCECGNNYLHFLGIFLREIETSGATREQAVLPGIELSPNFPRTVKTSFFKTAACPSCLSSKGFSETHHVNP